MVRLWSPEKLGWLRKDGFRGAVLPVRMEFWMLSAAEFWMPPPELPAELQVMVQLVMFIGLEEKMPPPVSCTALLQTMVQFCSSND